MTLFLLQSAPGWVRERYCDSGPNIIVTNVKLQAPRGFLRHAANGDLTEQTSGPNGGFSRREEMLEARVGIELKATLKIRKLLVILNEKKAKNREFAVVRYTAGTRIAI
jgi:hypothetical protein